MTLEISDPTADGHSMGPADLAALVAARVCHDLASPLGAIGNGMELVSELGAEAARDELEMVGRSAARAAVSLAALRLAFGGAGGAPIAANAVAARLDAYLGSAQVCFEWRGEGALEPAQAQLAALMALAARALLGREGRLLVSIGAGPALPLAAEAEGPRAGWSPGLRSLLLGHGAPEPRSVEFALLGPAARAAGARLEPLEAPGRAGLRALPA